MPTIRIACVTANLLQIPAASEPSDPYSSPAEFSHQLRQTPARAGSSTTLRDLKDIEQWLRGSALDAIVTYLAAAGDRRFAQLIRPAPRATSLATTLTASVRSRWLTARICLP